MRTICHRPLVAGAVVASLLGLGLASPVAGDETGPVEEPVASDAPSPENFVHEDGERGFVGAPTDALADITDRLQLIADEHPDVFAGVALTSYFSAVEVYVTDLLAPSVEVARGIARQAAPGEVLFIENRYSLADLLLAQTNVASLDLADLSVTEITPSFIDDALVIGVDPGDARASSLLRSADPTVSTLGAMLAQAAGIDIGIVASAEVEDLATTRKSDTGPFNMGGEILSGGSACSLGVPLRINGVRYALTAGHCNGVTYRSTRGAVAGTRHTTAWPGNADRFGDWMLLRGSYSRFLFTGALSSSARSTITAGHLGTRATGREMCSSGRTTGERCRYVVTKTRTVHTVNGVTSGHQTAMRHDPHRTGARSCTGFQGGDSGGPIFTGTGTPGRVDVWGIVKGLTRDPLTGSCSYSFTQLSGVRAWNSTATVS